MQFTAVAWTVLVLGWAAAPSLGGLAKPLFWGSTVSFTLAPAFDATAYERMRRRRGWGVVTFWAGNLALHFAPLWALASTPTTVWDGVCAAALHVAWATWETGGTFRLDDCYVPLPRRVWVWLLASAVVSEVAIGCLH